MKKENIVHVNCGTDDNFSQHCGVMLCSLLENNQNNHLYIHIFTSRLSNCNVLKLKNILNRYYVDYKFYNIDDSSLDGVKFRNNNPLTIAAYYRILLSSILDNSIKKIIYLDCDIIVNADILQLYNLEITNYPLAAVRDPWGPLNESHRVQLGLEYGADYFNSGVLLVNLDYWRLHNSEFELLNFSKKDRIVYCHDQDALNYVFKNKWYRLSPCWNFFNDSIIPQKEFQSEKDKKEIYSNPFIIHYFKVESKPWYSNRFLMNKKIYYYYLNMTPWRGFVPNKKIPFYLEITSLINYIYSVKNQSRTSLKSYLFIFIPFFRFIRFVSHRINF